MIEPPRRPSRFPTRLAATACLLFAGSDPCRRPSAQEITVQDAPPPSASAAADLLRPSGSDRYREPTDWGRIPPWRQTSFYGLRAEGTVFIFVVDCSGSMADGDRLIRAKREIQRAVSALRWPQRFHVIFYNDRPIPMPGGLARSAGLDASRLLRNWFPLISAEGDTDPRAAMAQALGLRPDAVFLLSDGDFPEGTASAIAASNPKSVPIHCIDLGGQAGQLKRIAEASGGRYVSRP